jgi:Peptidase family C25
VEYPRVLSAVGGVLEGSFAVGGRAEVLGLSASSYVLDLTESVPSWVRGGETTGTGYAFGAGGGRHYLVVDAGSVLRPEVVKPLGSTLRNTDQQADYVVVGPRAFLQAAQPLLDLRRSQGLSVVAASTEEVTQEFGYGEEGPGAIKAFLDYAYQNWQRPSFRYVLLLGDATYDPKNYLGTGVKNQVPPLIIKTSYLWTASDPAYAAVNGDDIIPDVALGRLPAGSVAQVVSLVQKIVYFEMRGENLSGKAVLVADNPDLAGDFEQNADELASGVLSDRPVSKIYLSQLGAGTRPAIVAAFDQGAGLVSYMGHGGTAVWASENVFNNSDVPKLSLQAQQPLLLTMNCLSGFFHFPPVDSLAEAIVKAEGKGAIAALSPSGLSLDIPAQIYQEALLGEIVSGRHERLGDAVLAAQSIYADSGAFPELLSIYDLLGDPALRIR